MVQIKTFPAQMDQLKIDPEHPNRTLVSGYFRENVKTSNGLRSFHTYLPEDMEYCQPCIVVAPPAGEHIMEFFERSGLRRMADEKKLLVALLIPEEQEKIWDLSGVDADYMNAVYAAIQGRDYYVTMQDNIYALGVGDGAIVAHQAVQKMASDWSGLMSFGDLSVPLDAPVFAPESKVKAQGAVELKIEGKRAQVPVWMVLPSMDGADKANNRTAVDYWRGENHTIGEPFSGQGADLIWMPSPVREHSEVNEEQIAQVRVTLNITEPNYEVLNVMWSYISSIRRHRGQGNKILRYVKDPIACGAEYREITAGGMTRIWYEYVPPCCTPDQPWPVVIVMHGRGGTAESFFDISCFSAVAQERKFIAVFPQSGPHQQKTNGLRNVLRWNGELEGEPIDEISFLRALLEDLASRHQIDRGRVYACGQSAGGIMSDCLWWGGSDFITAVACWSGLYHPKKVCFNYEMTEPVIPTLAIFGDGDRICTLDPAIPDEPFDPAFAKFPFRLIPELEHDLEVKLERAGCNPANLETWECGPIAWYCYPNAQGIPMLTVGIVRDMAHANYPEESWLSWDEFFCHFRRNTAGELFYRGKLVQPASR